MKIDGIELFNYILKNVDSETNVKRKKINIKELEKISEEDFFDIVFNTKKFLFNVWELSLTSGIKKNIEIDFNNISIENLFDILFENDKEFQKCYIFYKERKLKQSKIQQYLKNK